MALMAVGACMDVEIHIPPVVADALKAAGKSVPPPVTGMAMVDTGATLTCANEDCLKKLNLPPIGTVTSLTANGPVLQNQYVARLYFPRMPATFNAAFELIALPGSNLTGQKVPVVPPQDLIVLIGRTALARCILVWNGPAGYWSLSH